VKSASRRLLCGFALADAVFLHYIQLVSALLVITVSHSGGLEQGSEYVCVSGNALSLYIQNAFLRNYFHYV
jgi:hypothetical protein